MEPNCFSLKTHEELRKLLNVLRAGIQELQSRRPPGFEERVRLFETEMMIILIFSSARGKIGTAGGLEQLPHQAGTVLYHRALCEWRCQPEEDRTLDSAFRGVAAWVDAFQDLGVAFGGLRQELKIRLNDRLALEKGTSFIEPGTLAPREFTTRRDLDKGSIQHGGRDEGGSGLSRSKGIRSKRKIASRDAALRIVRFRGEQGYFNKDFAERFNISTKTIGNSIRDGRFSRELLDKFAQLMKTDFPALVNPEPEVTDKPSPNLPAVF